MQWPSQLYDTKLKKKPPLYILSKSTTTLQSNSSISALKFDKNQNQRSWMKNNLIVMNWKKTEKNNPPSLNPTQRWFFFGRMTNYEPVLFHLFTSFSFDVREYAKGHFSNLPYKHKLNLSTLERRKHYRRRFPCMCLFFFVRN